MSQYRDDERIKGKMDTFCVVIASLVCLLMSIGCGKVHYKEDAKYFAESILVDLDEKVAAESPPHEETADEPLVVSFQDICERAAFADANILETLSEIKKSKIDAVEASTHIWPRLNMQVKAELPIDSDFADEFELTGGLYFKYDIWQAVAQPDETVLRDALIEKGVQKLRLLLNGIIGDILSNLAHLSLLDFKIEQKTAGLDSVRKGYELVEFYAKQNRVKGLELLSWKKRIYTLTGELKLLEQKRREKYNKLLALAGISSNREIAVSGSEEIMIQVIDVPGDLPLPSEIWKNHNEARLAEVEYMAAEVLFKLAKMERYPKLNASLGLGSIPLSGNDGQANSLFQLSMSMPLWDAGDQKRKIARAEINRNIVKDRMKLKAVNLWQRANRAKRLYKDSLEYRDHLDQISKDSEAYFSGRKRLVEEKRLDSLDLLQDQIQKIDSAIMDQEAELQILEAAANYRFAIGRDVIDEIIPAIETNLLLYASKIIDDGSEYDIELGTVKQ